MKATTGILACLAVLLAPAPARAHHAFAVEFDAKNCADVTGVLTQQLGNARRSPAGRSACQGCGRSIPIRTRS